MPARGRLWQGVPGAGGRGTGPATGRLCDSGDADRLCRDAGPNARLPVKMGRRTLSWEGSVASTTAHCPTQVPDARC